MAAQLASRLGGFVAELDREDIPDDVLEVARCALLHNLAVAAAGAQVVAVPEAWARSRVTRPGTGARTFRSGIEVTPADAAFVNACLVHARAQDDTYFPGLTHVGAATAPAVLALAERHGATLGDVVVALVAGYEIAAALGAAAAPVSTRHGFRASGIYGPFGAAAGTSKILDLDSEAAAHAIAIASSFSSGTNQTWVGGSSEWQLQLGNAARSGLEAATVASFGATGSADAFEGAAGFYAAYARNATVADSIGNDLGAVWRTRDVTFKAHPVCAILQGPVEAAIGLRAASGGTDLAAATLRLSPAEFGYPGTDRTPPFTDPGSALMSATYCLGLALGHGGVNAADLARSEESGLRELSARVDLVADPALDAREFVVEVEWSDGRKDMARQPDGRPGPWPRPELDAHLARLQPEATGIDLAAVAAVVDGDLDAPASRLVDAMIAN